MSSIYDIDFNQQAIDLTSPDKRGEATIAWTQAFLKACQWARDLVLGSFKTGAIAPKYAPGTYNIYDQVIYKQRVYECLTQGTTNTPDNTIDWRLIQNNFIGVDERVLYNGNILVLTWALNKWFFTTYRNPPALSDIYLVTNTISTPVFRVGLTEDTSSSVGLDGSSENVWNDYDFINVNEFTIFIPLLVYNALDTNPVNRDPIVRNFADRYVALSLKYNIQTY